MKPIDPEQKKRNKRDATMRIAGAGNVELVKRGAARYDFSDPYHIAIELSWKEFALAFVGLELGINILRPALSRKPRLHRQCAAGLVLRRILFQHRDTSDRGLRNHGPGNALWPRRIGD